MTKHTRRYDNVNATFDPAAAMRLSGLDYMQALGAGWGFTTAELKINHTREIRPDGGPLRAEGSVIHRSQRMATVEGLPIELRDGKLYAHGSTTCFLFALADAKA